MINKTKNNQYLFKNPTKKKYDIRLVGQAETRVIFYASAPT